MNLTSKLTPNQRIFFAEILGTFVVVVCATGSVVLNAKSNGTIGSWFEAFAPFVGVCLMVYAFGKVSRAHFNPAVTVSYFITRHITKTQLPIYFAAESIGAFSGIIFVKNFIGTEAHLGVNVPNYSFPLWTIFGMEVLATALLMAVIMCVVHTNGLRGFSGIVIGGIIGLDIFFLAFISGASMNPIRSLAPAVFSGIFDNLWLYWTATFLGSSIIGFMYRRKFVAK
ncbi:MAG: aquaporin [Thaumarchaeota archaeon]|nr:aquaporin [Nitrososphaerota archaeon]